MDPLTALGVASNVIQIVDFSTRLVSKSQKIYKSGDGTLAENVDTETVAKDLRLLNSKLEVSFNASKSSGVINQDDQSLLHLCEKCHVLSDELLLKLEKLKVIGKHRKWKSARQALKSVCGKGDIEQFGSRLVVYRDEINLNITVSLRERLDVISSQQSKRFDNLDNFTRSILEAILNRTTDIMNAVPANTKLQTNSNLNQDLLDAARIGDRVQLRNILNRGTRDVDVNIKDAYGRTALHLASISGHSLLIQTLLNSNVKLEAEDNTGQTALHCAATHGHWAVLRMLLSNGANKDAEDDEQRIPVHYVRLSQNIDQVACRWILGYGHTLETRDDYGDTLLHFAARGGFEDLINYLLDKGAGIEALGGAGATPLVLAAGQGKQNAARLLLNRGARIEAVDPNQSTALMHAAWKGHTETVRILLDRGGDIEAQNLDGHTSLFLASILHEHVETIRLLLQRGAKRTDDLLFLASRSGRIKSTELISKAGANIEWRDPKGTSPLIGSSYFNVPAAVKILIESGANIEGRRSDGASALWVAAEEGHQQVVEILIDNGADVECRALPSSTTPLMISTLRNKYAVAQALLNAGAKLEARRHDGATALFIAAEAGREKIVRLMIKNGANLESKGQDLAYTPLTKASQQGRFEVVKILVENGADIESTNKDGVSALHETTFYDHVEIADFLISRGADLESRDVTIGGLTPLIRAASDGRCFAIVRLLCRRGADIEARSHSDQRSALAEAAGRGNIRITRYLLQRGAEVETRDRKGRTPIMDAAQSGHESIVAWLLRYGAYSGAKDLTGATAITLAARAQHDQIVEMLR